MRAQPRAFTLVVLGGLIQFALGQVVKETFYARPAPRFVGHINVRLEPRAAATG